MVFGTYCLRVVDHFSPEPSLTYPMVGSDVERGVSQSLFTGSMSMNIINGFAAPIIQTFALATQNCSGIFYQRSYADKERQFCVSAATTQTAPSLLMLHILSKKKNPLKICSLDPV